MTLPASKNNIKTFIALLFVVSGIAGLIYQIVWFKYLSLFLGNSTYAQMTVLAAFFGGLALGNFLFGQRADSFSNPIIVYSLLELFIGIYCVLYPTLSTYAGNVFLSTAAGFNLDNQSFVFNALRFFTAALLLLAPTTAMGGTLPVLSKFFVEKIQDTRKEIGTLYFLNSFGAVIGVIFAGFVLVKEFGLLITIYSTAVINILAGLAALYLALTSFNKLNREPEAVKKEKENATVFVESKTILNLIVIIAGISGFASFLYEMVWTRLLINFFGSSTYAFSIMLLSFISGITIGGFLITQKFLARFNHLKLLAFCHAAIGMSVLLILVIYDRLPYYLWKISALFSKTYDAFDFFLLVEFAICFSMILLPTLFMGMSLPLATEYVALINKKAGASVGKIFSVNTIGTVAGVLITGLVLIPLWGIKVSFEVGVSLNILSCILLVLFNKRFSFKTRFIYTAVPVLIFVTYLILFPSWNKSVMLSGVFKSFGEDSPKSYEQFLNRYSNEKIIFYQEGSAATVAVTQLVSNPNSKRLIINGKPDASTSYDMPTQILLGQIPMMLHPNPKNVFVVGFGSGTTIGSVLTHPVSSVVCAEISKEVITAAKYFCKENLNCAADTRLKLVNEDALTLLKLSKEKYDAIISEPSNPWIAGIGNLFSKEYFQKCYDKITDNGIMVQWFHLYEADDDVVRLVLNTFASVFPYAQLWNSVSNDIILIGSKKMIALNFNELNKKSNLVKVKKDMGRIGLSTPFSFLLCQMASERIFYEMCDKNPINSEIQPRLEFLAPRAFYVGKPSTFIYAFDERFDTLKSNLYVKNYAALFPPSKNELVQAIQYCSNSSKNARLAYGLAVYLKKQFPNDYVTNSLYATSLEKLSLNNTGVFTLERLVKSFPDSLQTLKTYCNSVILDKINSACFLGINSIENEVNYLIKISKQDTLSILKVCAQVVRNYYQNSEYDKAEKACILIEDMLKKSPGYVKKINLEEYFYIYATISLYKKNMEMVFANYLSLLNYSPNYPNLRRLRALVSWDLNKNKLKYVSTD